LLKNSSNRHNWSISMKKSYIYHPLILAFSWLIMGLSPIADKPEVKFEQEKIAVKTANGEYTFDTEIAKTKEQLETGLMYRESLAQNKAMLFMLPGNERVGMWMKNTLIPLDMLFIDKLGKIVYIARNTKPNSLDIISAGDKPVNAVLELKAGTAEAKNINIGDKVIYKGEKK
jgi:uncharacterized protein